MDKRYIVDLTADARAELLTLLPKGVAPARKLTRARILLLADEGAPPTEPSPPPPSTSTRPRLSARGGAASRAGWRRR